ncbi:MAG TPA: MarR family transcriptional regulator [Algoriphagus sp.]|jgi:DNA-binding MarR family transcriptional regulator|uniref:MarR family winged helix-turn-helix transcriptional regulator n=1 Tax=Algoriphagus TaxID=246875 RepID=UPI000C616264|nr:MULTISPECIES: MarR family winged helix-turn-helix transcriptional regulator [Algoriphagus]MAL12111.1 MarR family transcriptional regulator [Algoriphagus sp.]MAN87039.1 MarR family transcriptional regulator [Algoriphagus sp.]QYH40496.1 winged helix-turn-helix transcriptional regulator [Algoriphagus sp. NBT04N3]HAH38775.1 MarR family transcriptional regulator [Algoriphagus sp.]HAZ26953.1 MarR family transcriptional regulator [Algoriphagus sp.]|tara:strand:+ start:1083 stop:1544 length:462 start_codon:yes stop_codon:yes gene_type:complete
MKREETVDFHIKSAWHAISRMYNQHAAEEGFTTAIGFVLININSKEGTPATKIAPKLGLETRSLTRMLKTMEEKGLVYKKPDLVDKRSVRIYLTEEGKRKKEISVKTIKEFNEQIRQVIPEKDLESFFATFEKIQMVIDQFSGIEVNKPIYEL